MTSIFDLKENTSDLSSANHGITRYEYEQVSASRDITGDNFANGLINMNFQISGTKWWLPSHSNLRLRYTLTDAAGVHLTRAAGIAPNMGLTANLFQSMDFHINGKSLCSVSENVAQVDALYTRMNKSKAWIDSVGNSTNHWEAKVSDRVNKVSSDGFDSKVRLFDLTKLQLGLDALNTVAYTTATRTFTFADGGGGAPALDGRNIAVGDSISFPALNAASNNVPMVITGITATTIVVAVDTPGADVVAAVRDFTISRTTVIAGQSRRLKGMENVWQPPLPVFKQQGALAAGDYKLVLSPENVNNFKNLAVEATTAGKAQGVDFKFSIVDMYLNVATLEGDRVDNKSYLLDMDNIRCQFDDVKNAHNLTSKKFDVSPSTYALTVAFQDNRAGSDPLYSRSKLKVHGDAELNLERLFIKYAGVSKPNPDADPSYVGDATDYTTRRYVESLLNTGGYHETGGSETIEDWHDRGAYYHFNFPKDGSDASTKVDVGFKFNTANANTRVVLYEHSKSIGMVKIQDGRVVDVQVKDA